MSLGYARDSIADLQKLYNTNKEEDDDKFFTTPPASRDSNNLSLNSGEDAEGDSDDDGFMFYDDDADDNDGNGNVNDVENNNNNGNINVGNAGNADNVDDLKNNTSSNNNSNIINTNVDGVNSDKHPTTTATTMATTDDSRKMKRSPSTFIVVNEPLHVPEANDCTSPGISTAPSMKTTTATTRKASTTGKVSTSTSTPTTDLAKNKIENTTSSSKKKNIFSKPNATSSTSALNINTTVPNYYSGFDYTNYDSDYGFNAYVDPYGPNNYNKSLISFSPSKQGGGGGGTNRNIFCCFFPEKSLASTDNDDSSSSSSSDSSIGTSRHVDDGDSDISLDTTHHGLDIDLSLSGSTSFESVGKAGYDVGNNIHSETNASNGVPSLVKPPTISNIDQNLKQCVKEKQNQSNAQSSQNTSPQTQIPETKSANEKTSPSVTKANNSSDQVNESSETGTTATFATTAATTNSIPTTTPVRKSTPSTSKHKVPLKGILKHTVTKPESNPRNTVSPSSAALNMSRLNSNNNSDTKNNESKRRRNILPSYDLSTPTPSKDEQDPANNQAGYDTKQEKTKHHVSFSPMARVVNVTARSDLSFFSRSLIWWQRNDYDDFKKTGRIIAKAMLCGGSEIWLQTSNAWGQKQGHTNASANIGGGNNDVKATQHMEALKKYGVTDKDFNNEEKDEDMGSKWWCKFGHSRRGLEHIVSIEEGRQRQRFVNIAIQAVLDEQRRQRVTRRDPNKIAAVSMQYTSWARDLATAAGSADAEAVKSNFDSKAKCRIHHLTRSLSGRASSGNKVGGGGIVVGGVGNGSVPSATFILSANSALTAKVLDANTHSFRVKRIDQDNRLDEEKRSTPINVISKQAAGFQFQTPA